MLNFKNKFYLVLISIIFLLFLFPFTSVNGNLNIESKNNNNFSKYQDNIPVLKPTKEELHYYNISVDYSPISHSASGWINISFLNKEQIPISNLLLHLWGNGVENDSILIHNILNNSGVGLAYNVNNTKLNITTGQILENQRYNISINFTTSLPMMPDGSRFGYSEGINSYHAFGNWHPILSVRENGNWNQNPIVHSGEGFYSEMAYFDIQIKTSSSDKIAAAADLQKVTKINNEFIYHFTSGPVRDFAWITSPDYLLYSEIYKGVNISSYYFPGNTRATLAVDITKKSLDLFSEIFEPWPYETMTIAELDPAFFGGMEYNQLIMINSIYYDPEKRSIERFEDIISHEWAHAWNTYLVANNPYLDPWLDESWAMYSTSLYYEEYGKQDYEKGRQETLKTSYFEFRDEYPDYPLGSGFDYWDFNPGIGSVVYYKGAVVIDMLRYVMGDTAFFEAVIDFYDTFSYKTVSASEFIDLFNGHVDDNISWFFDQFVYDTAILDYEILSVSVFEFKLIESWDVSIMVGNYYESTPNVMKVPFTIKTSNNSLNFEKMIDDAQESFTIQVPFSYGEPEVVSLDPEWVLLRQPGIIEKHISTGDSSVTKSSTDTSDSNITTASVSTTNLFLLPTVVALIPNILYRKRK
ncbi:MAG: M1 family aminopeptidase [Candidatus Hodarchaeales archaeon]